MWIPFEKNDLLDTVQKIIKTEKRDNPFKDDRPGRTWLRLFFKRNPYLSLREAETISKGRAVVTKNSIKKWFHDLESFLIENGHNDILLDPDRIMNGDETSFSLCPKTGKVVAPKGFKNVYQVQMAKEKDTITVLAMMTASGELLPPLVIFPYIRPPKEIVMSVPKNWFMGKTSSGWMRSETFYEYIANCVVKWIDDKKVKKPVLLFVDGHKSHLSMQLSQLCADKNIILYALPPNTTHILQPADVSIFKPLKEDWKKTVREWHIKHIGTVLTRKDFCPLLETVLSNNNHLAETIRF